MAAAVRAPRASRPRLRVPVGRDPGLFWRAINRLAAVMAIANWRAAAGEAPTATAIARHVEVVVDALRHADGGGRRYTFDVPAIRTEWLPGAWRDAITDDQIYVVVLDVERTRSPADLMTPGEVGRLLRLHAAEVESMDRHVAFRPIDASAAEHEACLLERKRAGARERSRRYRATKNIANPRHALPFNGQRDAGCNIAALTQEAAAFAAIVGGATKVADIVRMTGIPATTAYPILTRLLAAGSIRRTGRGRYAPSQPAHALEGSPDAIAVAVHSGPENPPDTHEPPFETLRDATPPALVADIGRALEARETAGAGRPRTPAGPDGVIRLVPSTALNPHRPVFSRLPGSIFLINRSANHAASRRTLPSG